MTVISIQEVDAYGHQDVVVDGGVVGSIFDMHDGLAVVNWSSTYLYLHPDVKRTVTELADRCTAIRNVTRRLTS